MFLKPFKIKSNAPLGGKDIKQLKQFLEKSFPKLTENQNELVKLLPPKANVSLVKIITHTDFTTNVYCVEKVPMFFEIEGNILVPTLYALWLVDMLPFFTTHKNVLNNLANGADLMLPGVCPLGTGQNMYGRFQKGALVAVNLTNNLSAHGVGYLARSSDDLYMSGGRGVAVKMLHIFGDKLWGHEPGLTQQVPNRKQAALTQDDFPALGEEPKKARSNIVTMADVVSSQNNVIINEIDNSLKLEELNIQSDENPSDLNNVEGARTNDRELNEENTSTEVTSEQKLKQAFLTAIKNNQKALQPLLPLLTSTFYRQFMVPEVQPPIDLKHTKYKKLSNFLREMADEKFLIVKEESKGIDKITEINYEHNEIVNFITDHKTSSSNGNMDGGQQQQPLFHTELTETYLVTEETAAFFAKVNYKRNEPIPATEVKKVIREYLNRYRLKTADPISKSLELDDTLKNICGKDAATLKEITSHITGLMEHSYQMCTAKDVKSNKPLIQLSLATRSGNKKVTLINNLECYGIILPEFMKLCKQGAAASITTIQMPNHARETVQIQGNQMKFITNLLTDVYKIQPKCILGVEAAKTNKKKPNKK